MLDNVGEVDSGIMTSSLFPGSFPFENSVWPDGRGNPCMDQDAYQDLFFSAKIVKVALWIRVMLLEARRIWGVEYGCMASDFCFGTGSSHSWWNVWMWWR